MIILLFIESRLNFINIPLNSTFKSSINYEYIVYRNENPISCFLEFLVSLILKQEKEYQRFYSNFHLQGSNSGIQSDCTSTPSPNSPHSSSSSLFGPGSVGNIFHSF